MSRITVVVLAIEVDRLITTIEQIIDLVTQLSRQFQEAFLGLARIVVLRMTFGGEGARTCGWHGQRREGQACVLEEINHDGMLEKIDKVGLHEKLSWVDFDGKTSNCDVSVKKIRTCIT